MAIGAPGGYRRRDPTNYGTSINDVGITASNGLNCSIYRNLMYYLHAIDEVTVIYQSKELDDWIVIRNPSVEGLGERFEAMDQGGAFWKLSTRHLVTSDRAIAAGPEFLENDGVIMDLSDWEPFPEDFI